jgi:hypothetical protein
MTRPNTPDCDATSTRAASHAEYLTYRVEDLAELVRSCGEDIYRELVAIEGRTEAPLEFAKGVTERIDTLVEVIRETAEQIRADIEEATEGNAAQPLHHPASSADAPIERKNERAAQ